MSLFTVLLLAWLTILPPPQIGNLAMPPKYWLYTLEAAEKHRISPYVIAGVMAIESRYDPRASSEHGRCKGLMQLCRTAVKKYRIDPWDPRQNIMVGARILGRLLRKHHGNLRAAVREYNGTGNQAYIREVLKAVRQAKRNAAHQLRRMPCQHQR